MKVLLLNGSPRKGNTLSALESIAEGIEEEFKSRGRTFRCNKI